MKTTPKIKKQRIAVVQVAVIKKVPKQQEKKASPREQRIAKQIGQLAPLPIEQAKRVAQKVAELNEITSALLSMGEINKTLAKAKIPPLE